MGASAPCFPNDRGFDLDGSATPSHHSGVRLLADLDVLIVDCQTTGASPAFGSVLELGWGVARASRAETEALQAHWIALPEGERVPRHVQRITGYQPAAHSAHAIAAEEAWRRLRSTVRFAEGMPTAIHYARFELAFLRDWAQRFEPETPFPIDAICMHALALRLYPELPRQSLRALAGYLGHGLDLARRSLGHVEATAFVWRKLSAELERRGVASWEELQAFLNESAPVRNRAGKLKYPLASERYKSLPDAPGVYRFLRSNGDVLYVGKATSLKKRTTSHFAARASKELAPEMLTQVADIQATVTASALEAALLENQLIKQLRPPYNVQLASSDSRVWYSTREFDRARPVPDLEHRIGPLASEYSLRPLHALIALSSGSAATAKLRADVVGVSDLWTPDEEVFAAGFRELMRRHPAELSAAMSPRRGALELGRKLLRSRALSKVAESDEIDPVQKPEGWDPERVARHIERAAAQAYQTYRRARWLELLHDCNVVYREPKARERRELRVRDGEILTATSLDAASLALSDRGTRPHFDRSKYDRLRILSSELKRISRDGGEVSLSRATGRTLSAALLPGALRLV